jgi:2-polyprenyl-3-methyl-5-hydroxy-6-metoxy-1,4-benzoquinol methylase
MLHAYIGVELAEVKDIVKEPFKSYLKSSIGLLKSLAKELDYNISNLTENEFNDLLELVFERYWETSALLGTTDSCKKLLSSIYEIGVTEIACLVDFGIENEKVLEGLNYLNILKEDYGKEKRSYLKDSSSITTLQITPSYLEALVNDDNSILFLESLEHIVVGGENFSTELLTKLNTLTNATVYNMYGPTETTIWSTFQKVKKGEVLTIGKPISNTRVYVLDGYMNPVPVGVTGELYIGGAGLSRGYLNRLELTSERFIANPFATEADKAKGYTRLYKTGDLVRWLADGNLEYLGRNDEQVKIRGYRIEPGEVEHALSQVAGIRQSCVVVRERETEAGTIKYLAGYYVPDGTNIPVNDSLILDSWEDLYDTEYKKTIASDQTESDFSGWNSYITGEAFPLAEMELWRTRILGIIRSLSPGHVLEVGVGTGLLMYPLLGTVQQYTGLDISQAVINRHQEYLKEQGDTVSLYHLKADQLDGLPEGALYDTIIINSVCQYFPGIDYFNKMLDQAFRRLSSGGSIFLGDIRNYDLQKELIAEKLSYCG